MYRRFRRGKQPLPLLPILGGVVAPAVQSMNVAGGLAYFQQNPMDFMTNFLDQMGQRYTGFALLRPNNPDNTTPFNISLLAQTYGGLIAGVVGHKLATKFGVNRQMRRIPFLGKYIEL